MVAFHNPIFHHPIKNLFRTFKLINHHFPFRKDVSRNPIGLVRVPIHLSCQKQTELFAYDPETVVFTVQ